MTTILVADDSGSFQSTVKYTLKTGGYEAVQAEDGQTALDLIAEYRERGKTYDLLLVDIHMPGMSGYELVERVRKMPEYHSTPIIFLTTENSDEAKQHGRDLNATGWINKPYRPEVLLDVLRKVLARDD